MTFSKSLKVRSYKQKPTHRQSFSHRGLEVDYQAEDRLLEKVGGKRVSLSKRAATLANHNVVCILSHRSPGDK